MEAGPQLPAEATHESDAIAPSSHRSSRRSTRARRLRRIASIVVRVSFGLTVGLGVAEAVFRHRDGGAFPLVNVYAPDDQCGVRLTPGSSTIVGKRSEPITHVRINRDGYRGADWPPAAPSDIVVVGDSLSFGLGVEENEALAARLRAALPGAPAVLDASVPTYGPPEYLVTMNHLLSQRQPRTVVIVVNPINDLAEIDHPNTDRHTAVDGWAARIARGSPPRTSSPLRTWAIQRSHAAFALWRWVRTREAEAADVEPEPGLEVPLALATRVAADAHDVDDHARDEARRVAAIAAAWDELRAARREIVRLVRKHKPLVGYAYVSQLEWSDYVRYDGEPRDDVFSISYGGCAPSRPQNTRFFGARIRDDVESELKDFARILSVSDRDEIVAAFAHRAEVQARLARLPVDPLPPPPRAAPLPLAPFFREAHEQAATHGARLVIVAAPLDAQVSADARRRREITDDQASMLDALSSAIATAATRAGALGVDATPALKEAGSAAFLEDGHLSAIGHDAVARAIAGALDHTSADAR